MREINHSGISQISLATRESYGRCILGTQAPQGNEDQQIIIVPHFWRVCHHPGAPGPKASYKLKKMLATAISFYTSFQMSINYASLHGLVNLDKEAELVFIEDEEGDEQEAVTLTVCQEMFSHEVNHLPLWQAVVQNDNGS